MAHDPGGARVTGAGAPARDASGMADAATTEPITFVCPRCETEVQEAYWGPCALCRADLRATLGGEAKQVEQEAYEPKMNVTPNAVATKD